MEEAIMYFNYRFGDYTINNDPSKLNLKLIYEFLTESYWAKGRSFETVKTSVENSLCFGVYHNKKQVGFARLITDCSTFAYLADVFIIESYRSKGLGKFLIECILDHPCITDKTPIMLATHDAHELYGKYGFKSLENSQKYMRKAW